MCPCMYTVYVPVILIEYFSSTYWDQYFHTFLTYSRCNYVIISNGLPYIKTWWVSASFCTLRGHIDMSGGGGALDFMVDKLPFFIIVQFLLFPQECKFSDISIASKKKKSPQKLMLPRHMKLYAVKLEKELC